MTSQPFLVSLCFRFLLRNENAVCQRVSKSWFQATQDRYLLKCLRQTCPSFASDFSTSWNAAPFESTYPYPEFGLFGNKIFIYYFPATTLHIHALDDGSLLASFLFDMGEPKEKFRFWVSEKYIVWFSPPSILVTYHKCEIISKWVHEDATACYFQTETSTLLLFSKKNFLGTEYSLTGQILKVYPFIVLGDHDGCIHDMTETYVMNSYNQRIDVYCRETKKKGSSWSINLESHGIDACFDEIVLVQSNVLLVKGNAYPGNKTILVLFTKCGQLLDLHTMDELLDISEIAVNEYYCVCYAHMPGTFYVFRFV